MCNINRLIGTLFTTLCLFFTTFCLAVSAGTSPSDNYYIFGEERPLLAIRNTDGTWGIASVVDLNIGVTKSTDKKRREIEQFDILVNASRMKNTDIPKGCIAVFKTTWPNYKKTFKGKGQSATPQTSKLWSTRYSPDGEEAQRVELSNGSCKVLLEVGGPSEKYLKDYIGLERTDIAHRAKVTEYPNDLGVAFIGKHGRISFRSGKNKFVTEFLLEHSEPPQP